MVICAYEIDLTCNIIMNTRSVFKLAGKSKCLLTPFLHFLQICRTVKPMCVKCDYYPSQRPTLLSLFVPYPPPSVLCPYPRCSLDDDVVLLFVWAYPHYILFPLFVFNHKRKKSIAPPLPIWFSAFLSSLGSSTTWFSVLSRLSLEVTSYLLNLRTRWIS